MVLRASVIVLPEKVFGTERILKDGGFSIPTLRKRRNFRKYGSGTVKVRESKREVSGPSK